MDYKQKQMSCFVFTQGLLFPEIVNSWYKLKAKIYYGKEKIYYNGEEPDGLMECYNYAQGTMLG